MVGCDESSRSARLRGQARKIVAHGVSHRGIERLVFSPVRVAAAFAPSGGSEDARYPLPTALTRLGSGGLERRDVDPAARLVAGEFSFEDRELS